MDIFVGAKVHCSDKDAGHVTCVVINPVTDDMTHVVVYDHQLLGMERLVPITLVTTSTTDGVWLKCSLHDLSKCQPFIGVDYDFLDTENTSMYAETAYWPTLEPMDTNLYGEGLAAAEYEEVPPGEVVIHRGAPVRATDGLIGHVHEFVANPETGHITHIVLSRGHLWGKQDIAIPLSSVKAIEDDGVQLRLDIKAVSALPKLALKRERASRIK